MSLKKVVLGTAVVLGSANVFAYEAGDFILRAGVAVVAPQEDASPDIVGVGNDTQLGLTGTYMLTNNLGIELLASTPFTHDVTLKSTGKTVAEVKHLPPTVSLQYFIDTGSIVTPYVGAGVNFFMVQESRMTSYGEAALGTSAISVGDSIGLALSAGMDVKLTDDLVLNAAVWKIDVETTADIGHGTTKIDVDIDPWVYMVGLGYKF
jgi:outer membrane protein